MAASIKGVFEDNLQNSILSSKIFLVGAGGIGCEILKNLVLSGFKDIEIIDLDTIDVSNLNRQFLFHKEHVGKSKAEVARESALKFNPNVSIKAYHDSITSSEYGVNFFKRFSLIMNALDNKAARNHVNRLCLGADLPLIESGTAGYSGQVELIKKNLSQCYECLPKASPKTFPGCTIRNTPSEPIHCIVWAKHLFNQLFGEYDPEAEVSPDMADPEAVEEGGEPAITSHGNIDRVSTRKWAENCCYNVQKLFTKFFYEDIQYLLSMQNLWKERRAPTPLKWAEISESDTKDDQVSRDQRHLSLAECCDLFKSSIAVLFPRVLESNSPLVWDKDDQPSMDFVAACANIRSLIFGIEVKSKFEIKSMAGNIIPAIATTNAIVAGLAVLQAFKILQDKLKECTSVYVRLNENPQKQILVPEKFLIPPNPKCYVCSSKPEVTILVDVNKMTVGDFEEKVLKKALNMIAPDAIYNTKQIVVISSEEGETEINRPKTLKELQIVDGSILQVDDFLQNYELVVTISHHEPGKDEPEFQVISDPESLKPKDVITINNSNGGGPSTSSGVGSSSTNQNEDDDDDLVLVEGDDSEVMSPKSRKRITEIDLNNTKKRKSEVLAENQDQDQDDDDDDLVMIDEPSIEV